MSFFVHHSLIQFRYFWWNYFLNNFSLLVGLLRPVCFLMTVGTYSLWPVIINQQYVVGIYIFWWNMSFNKSFYIASHGIAIYFLLWTSSLFFFLQTFLLINSTFLCFDLLSSSYYLATCVTCFRVSGACFWPFLVHFWLLWILVTVHEPCLVPHASRITAWGTIFREIFLVCPRNGSDLSSLKLRCWLKIFWQFVQKKWQEGKKRKKTRLC